MAGIGVIQGCASLEPGERYNKLDPATSLPQTSYHTDILAHDGTVLRATVFQPALAADAEAPVIIHTHGFGAFRAPRRFSLYGQLVLSGQAAMAAWDAGYWVISYDQRGFGDSGGRVHLMDPDYEVRDFISVLDWADQRLPRVRRAPDGDPYVGASGESYGGAVQILASMQDSRLDAIVPIATWYDLETALAPNGVVQSFWPLTLDWIGTVSSGFDFDLINEANYQTALSGTIDGPTRLDLSRRSPSEYCASGKPIQADALFIQGLRDVLFPLNHGLANWRCARDAGRDAYLVAIQDGHIMPWPLQAWSGMPLFNTQRRIRCGNYHSSAIAMMTDFWDQKLKGQPLAKARPPLCLTMAGGASFGEGIALDGLVRSVRFVPVPETSIKLGFSGVLELLLYPWDMIWGWLTPASEVPAADQQPGTGGTIRPAFVPLHKAGTDEVLAGIPRLNLKVGMPAKAPAGMLFAALGVRHKGSPAITVLHEQFTPLPAPASHEVSMPGVVFALAEGDTVGLVLQGFAGAYYNRGAGWLHRAKVSGSVGLPLQ